MLVTGRDQRKRVPLRHKGLQRNVVHDPPQVGRQRRTLSHREDTGLGTRVRYLRGAVAGGEHERVRRRAQMIVDADEAVLVADKTRGGHPRLASG